LLSKHSIRASSPLLKLIHVCTETRSALQVVDYKKIERLDSTRAVYRSWYSRLIH
jgi:hypothetical protein